MVRIHMGVAHKVGTCPVVEQIALVGKDTRPVCLPLSGSLADKVDTPGMVDNSQVGVEVDRERLNRACWAEVA